MLQVDAKLQSSNWSNAGQQAIHWYFVQAGGSLHVVFVRLQSTLELPVLADFDLIEKPHGHSQQLELTESHSLQ